MRRAKLFPNLVILVSAILSTSCAPQQSNAAPTFDVIGTTAAQLASMMLTQTAAAYTPTPLPATDTPIPLFTDTPTLEPTPAVTSIPKISGNTACYAGPGSQYGLISNLSDTEEVYVMGIGSVPGWYVIENPIYGSLCWVSASYVTFDPSFDVSTLPTMYPP